MNLLSNGGDNSYMKSIRKTIKLFLLLGLVSVSVNTYKNNPTVRTATNDSISTLKEKISTLDASDLNPLKIVPPKVSNRPSDQTPSSESDNQQPNQPVTSNSNEGQDHETSSNQTWNHAKANVFIDISNNDELGHAIGLQHTNTASVMYPAGSYYSIQEQDINAARDLYKSAYAA